MSSSFNRERFAKVLALAESDQDGEALAAVRKATAMARAAGMSLGEAVAADDDGMSALLRLATRSAGDAAMRRRIGDLEMMVASLQAQLNMKRSGDERYQAGRGDGYRDGQKDAAKKFAQTDAFQAGYLSGYAAGEESERAATNRAYDRGYADGKASVAMNEKPPARRKRRAA